MQEERKDAAVVAAVLSGDREAYGELVRRHSRTIFALAFRVTGNENDAEEVVQEAWMKAYRSLSRFEQRSNFGTWLYRITMNCALDRIERRKQGLTVAIAEEPDPEQNEVQLVSDAPDAERVMFSGQVGDRIQKTMETLTRTERAAFVMRHLEGKSIEEIAAALGLKTGSAKNSIFRAVQKMRHALEPMMVTR